MFFQRFTKGSRLQSILSRNYEFLSKNVQIDTGLSETLRAYGVSYFLFKKSYFLLIHIFLLDFKLVLLQIKYRNMKFSNCRFCLKKRTKRSTQTQQQRKEFRRFQTQLCRNQMNAFINSSEHFENVIMNMWFKFWKQRQKVFKKEMGR